MIDTKIELNNKLTALIEQRKVWEDVAYKKANEELYAILEQCGAIYDLLKADKENARAFNAVAEAMGVKFTQGTSLALKIVRIVFGKEQNREQAYAKVIKVWYEKRDNAQTLTNFVIEHGGVENVRREKKATMNTLSAEDYRDIAADALSEKLAIAEFDVGNYMLSDKENETDYMVALVRYDTNGVGHVLYGSNKKVLVNTALAVIGKELDTLMKNTNSKQDAKDLRKQKAEDLKSFMQTQLTIADAA